jgi:hypothetical protein
MQPVTSTHPPLASTRCNLRDDDMFITRRHASSSLVRLENSSMIYFQAKQATRP